MSDGSRATAADSLFDLRCQCGPNASLAHYPYTHRLAFSLPAAESGTDRELPILWFNHGIATRRHLITVHAVRVRVTGAAHIRVSNATDTYAGVVVGRTRSSRDSLASGSTCKRNAASVAPLMGNVDSTPALASRSAFLLYFRARLLRRVSYGTALGSFG